MIMPCAGMVHPSAGDCEILGHSVRHDVAAARRSLGICPQQNVLFGTMTVEEHLVLYASIKEGLGASLCLGSAQTINMKAGSAFYFSHWRSHSTDRASPAFGM